MGGGELIWIVTRLSLSLNAHLPACIAREWSSSESGARVVSIEVCRSSHKSGGTEVCELEVVRSGSPCVARHGSRLTWIVFNADLRESTFSWTEGSSLALEVYGSCAGGGSRREDEEANERRASEGRARRGEVVKGVRTVGRATDSRAGRRRSRDVGRTDIVGKEVR